MLHKAHLNTELLPTFNGNACCKTERRPLSFMVPVRNQGLLQYNFDIFYHENESKCKPFASFKFDLFVLKLLGHLVVKAYNHTEINMSTPSASFSIPHSCTSPGTLYLGPQGNWNPWQYFSQAVGCPFREVRPNSIPVIVTASANWKPISFNIIWISSAKASEWPLECC